MARFAKIENYLENMVDKKIVFRSSEQKRDGALVYECDDHYTDLYISEFPYPGFVVFGGGNSRLRLNYVTDMFLENTKRSGNIALHIICGGVDLPVAKQEFIFNITKT